MALPDYVSANLRRRVIRSPINPLDKSTIVSIFPKEINEIKHTIQPGRFHIDKGSYENPSILVVSTSSWWREVDGDQMLEIPVGSPQVADSIVKDYCNGLLACDMGNSMPGLFWIPGNLTIEQVKLNYKELLTKARECQKKWFSELVKMGDILWSRSNGNPLSISDDMRLAVQELQLKEKAWMKDFTTLELKNCPACGTLRNSTFPICGNCHIVIDKVEFDKLGMKFSS